MYYNEAVEMAHRLVIRRAACAYCARCQSLNVRTLVHGMVTRQRSIYEMHAHLHDILGTDGYRLCRELEEALGMPHESLQRELDVTESRLAEIMALPDVHERTEDYVLLAADDFVTSETDKAQGV